MCLGTNTDADTQSMPHSFSERLLSIRLTKLWTSHSFSKTNKTTYDAISAQQSYERLQTEFIATLPPAFRVKNPNTQWDCGMMVLPRQRCMLRISVFVFICHLFRPLLQLAGAQLDALPFYKRNLIAIQRKCLVNAALTVLSDISHLHQLMGNKYKTNFFFLSFYTFEPSILLGLHLLSKREYPRSDSETSKRKHVDLLFELDTSTECASKIASEPPSDQKCKEALERAH